MLLWVQYGILKIMYHILCKTEASRPYQTHISTTNKCFDSTQMYDLQQRIKLNRIRASMIVTLSFFIENIYTRYIVLLVQWYTNLCHQTEFILESVVLKIVSPLPCSSELVRHILLFVYFFKGLIPFIGSLDKCHTSVFSP